MASDGGGAAAGGDGVRWCLCSIKPCGETGSSHAKLPSGGFGSVGVKLPGAGAAQTMWKYLNRQKAAAELHAGHGVSFDANHHSHWAEENLAKAGQAAGLKPGHAPTIV